MELKDYFQRYSQAVREMYDLETAWYRHLLTIAAGVLALTVSLQASTPASPVASWLLLATWVFLAVALCSGCAATYAQASAMQDFVTDFSKQLEAALDGDHPVQIVGVSGKPSVWLVRMKPVMVVSLLLSVVFLTAYGVTAILLAPPPQPP